MKNGKMMHECRYVLITACRNESAYIDGLIETVAEQTLRPYLWLIVDDCSTDDTYAKLKARVGELPFLQVTKMADASLRSFASQVYAQRHAYESVRDSNFQFIGFLDADIKLEKDYYAKLIQLFRADPKLGLCGGAVIDKFEDYIEIRGSGSEEFHVPGGVQFFRRECFDQIGGYLPVEGGGQDTIADIMSMMHGWNVKSFLNIRAIHMRPEGFGRNSMLRKGILWGRKFYLIGYHPLFYFGQCLRRIGRPPILFGSLFRLIGFMIAGLVAKPRPVSKEFVRFLRAMQVRRISKIISNR